MESTFPFCLLPFSSCLYKSLKNRWSQLFPSAFCPFPPAFTKVSKTDGVNFSLLPSALCLLPFAIPLRIFDFGDESLNKNVALFNVSISLPATPSQGLPSRLATVAPSGLQSSADKRDLAADKRPSSRQLSNRPTSSPQPMRETLYKFLLNLVKHQPPETVVQEFKLLFIAPANPNQSKARQALHKIIFTDDPEDFHNLLKRSCYILINNWNATRHHHAIHSLIELFADATIRKPTPSPQLKRLRRRLQNFIDSKDYQDLQLFAGKPQESRDRGPWAQRYASYLLVPQYANSQNPVEQRQAALVASRKLKEKFKFDLAMYTARAQRSATGSEAGTEANTPNNPTDLGDEARQLIQQLIAKRGFFNYQDLANIFLQQTQQLKYQDFKHSLQRYLIFSLPDKTLQPQIAQQLTLKLAPLYTAHHQRPLNNALLLRTCNRLIEALTIDGTGAPTLLFALFIVQGQPLTLAILLLKMILICRNSRPHLELSIAKLIQHYEKVPKESCKGLIRFLELHNLVMTIHADDMDFNLVNMHNGQSNGQHHASKAQSPAPAAKRRIFSQRRLDEEEEIGNRERGRNRERGIGNRERGIGKIKQGEWKRQREWRRQTAEGRRQRADGRGQTAEYRR